jgi:hypothetical protein
MSLVNIKTSMAILQVHKGKQQEATTQSQLLLILKLRTAVNSDWK